MSDPAYIETDDSHGKVTFYKHWGGDIKNTLADALVRGRSRWSDPSYLNRIIFCEIVKGIEDDVLGAGIFNGRVGTGDEHILVDLENKRVFYRDGTFSYNAWIAAFRKVKQEENDGS